MHLNNKCKMNFIKASLVTATLAATAAPSVANTPTETGAIPVSPSVIAGTSGDRPIIINRNSRDSTRTSMIMTEDGEEWEMMDDGKNYIVTEDGEEWRVA